MGPIKATNWAFQVLLSRASVCDIVQLQDLHQTTFISSLNWDVGQAIKSRKGALPLSIVGTALIFDAPNLRCAPDTFGVNTRGGKHIQYKKLKKS